MPSKGDAPTPHPLPVAHVAISFATNQPFMKILLADDNELIRECLGHFLTTEHVEVVVVQDGLEAIERLEEHAHASIW